MQFDEEEVEQDEVEETGEAQEPESLDDEEQDTREKLETAKPSVVRRPGNTGIWLTVFAAIVIIMLGGLASYYYYTFQRQGVSSEKSVKTVWTDAVDATQNLNDAADRLQKFQDVTDRTNISLSVAVDGASRTVRDGGISLQNQLGLDVRAATVGSKLAGFLTDYTAYLTELRRVLDHADTILAPTDLDALKAAAKQAETSYDSLLAVNNGFLKESLPRSVFDIGDKLTELLNAMIADHGSISDANKTEKDAADGVVSKFAQGWQDKSADEMGAQLTSGAKAGLTPAVLEDSVEILGLTITDTTVADDGSKITVKGDLKTQPPGGDTVTEHWQFILLPTGDKWLIDSWKKV